MVAREARDAGFRIALDHYSPGGRGAARAGEHGQARAAVLRPRPGPRRGVTLIADGVDTRETYQRCLELGFDGFQGTYFAEPVVLTGTAPPTYRLRALSMLVQDGDMTTFEQLERVIAEDPG